MSNTKDKGGGYAASDHKVMLADSILEIQELVSSVKELKNQLVLVQEDIEVMNRSLHDFSKQIDAVKVKSSEHLANVAVTAFEEQLEKVEQMIGRLLHDKSLSKRKWFWQR